MVGKYWHSSVDAGGDIGECLKIFRVITKATIPPPVIVKLDDFHGLLLFKFGSV